MQSTALRFLEVSSEYRLSSNDFETTVWITDPDIEFRRATILEEHNDNVTVGFHDENGHFEKRIIPKSEVKLPSVSYFVEDMCNLSELNDACVLEAVRSRYEAQLIHTYSGLFCIVVNPWKNIPIYTKEVMEVYMHTVDRNYYHLPPHIYAVAQTAYDGLLSGNNQSILITGESGAGKTVNTKRIIEYLGAVSEYRGQFGISDGIDKRLTAAGIVIEAFANASTIYNSNSSRLGKFIRMDYDDDMIMKGAQIQTCLLEKSRVVKQNNDDRNFHIFYQLLSDGFDKDLRYSFGLGQSANAYKFLNQGGKIKDPEIDDAQGAVDTLRAMDIIKFTKHEVSEIFEIVAACILLGEIKFTERSGLDITYVDGAKEVEAACRILGVKTSALIDAITQPSIKVNDVVIRKSQNLTKTLSSLSGLCKSIYERLFNWILSRCNSALSETFHPSKSTRTYYIGVLDIAGFEIIKMNSFEQFCINYTNEKLQQFFNDFMFIREQQEYLNEGIAWQYADYGTDMQNTIELIEKPLGLLSLLQEECLVPNGNDQSLLEKLLAANANSPVFTRSRQSARHTTVSHFSIAHYAGNVAYNINGWVEKNKDVVERNGLEVLAASTKPLLQTLFPLLEEEKSRSKRQSMSSNTVSYLYKEQLLNLLETLKSTMAHFIRCIAPNKTRLPGVIDPHLLLQQLRCNGVLEGIRICRQGYPNRMLFDEFVERYRILIPNIDLGFGRIAVQRFCDIIDLDPACVQIGKTKVYCKIGVISELENRRKNYLNSLISGIQAAIRWYLEQQRYEQLFSNRESILIIQKNIRCFIETSTWNWYRLLLIVKELIPLNKDKARLEELLKTNDELTKELSNLQRNYEGIQKLLDEANNKIKSLEDEKESHIWRNAEMKEELTRHEELMEIMEKRFDEQHAKVMKIHNCLQENEKKIEHTESEKKNLESQLYKCKLNCEREYELRRKIESDLKMCERAKKEMELKMELTDKEREKESNTMQELKEQVKKLTEHNNQQADVITDLRQSVMELNEKNNNFDGLMATEKKARKKLENERVEQELELEKLKENAQKAMMKMETLKESCREKDKEIRRLEKKLDQITEESETNIAEMKKIHKRSKDELQNRLDELKKAYQKLEAENKTQKMKLEYSEKERESSVESDYVSGGRQSRLGSRQYSSSSIGSIGSIRTLSRRTVEPENKFSSGFRSPSTFSLSYYSGDPYNLSRSSSQNQFANERKISQLERQIISAHTDAQMMKREIEVYKSTLAENEKERDMLSQKVRTLDISVKELEQSLSDEVRKNHEYELRLKRTQNELEHVRDKYEKAVKDGQTEILEERRKMRLKMDALSRANEMKKRYTKEEQTIEELQNELASKTSQLNRVLAQVNHLENINKSQGVYGETWEHQYRMALTELESLRDENASLKTKIRRQYREIELLKLAEQSEMEADVAMLENKMGISGTITSTTTTITESSDDKYDL
ncbi:Myosin head (motor domain) family protein [Acanthocheilonema viteae]